MDIHYIMNNFDKILDFTKLFWQYPVITEKTFYDQNRYHKNYIGIPWATIIDKIQQKQKMLSIIKSACLPNIEYFTCCQHINFRLLIPFFKMVNVKTLYTPHKVKNQDNIEGIQIVACPLYAVNFERYISEKKVDYVNIKREYLYSFMGAYNPNCYLTKIRKNIFNMKHPENTKIINTGLWHFEKSVYSNLQNYKNEEDVSKEHIKNTEDYNNLLLNSRFSLCPSGSGPNSIRLWESLACGSIPIILADTLDLPKHPLWEKAVVRIKEDSIDRIQKILEEIPEQRENEMRTNCMKIYEYFRYNFRNRKKHILFFSNCYAEKYIHIMKRDTDIYDKFIVKYIVSYQNLQNFDKYKNDFMDTDILIINNIKKYDNYTIANLNKYLKKNCLTIIVPFVRFEGYWVPEKYKTLKYIGGNSVSFFPM